MDKLSFALDKFDLMDISKTEIMKLKMYIVREGNNHHNRPISWETILKARDTLIGKPIVAKFDRWKNDLEGHEIDEVPVGVILKDEDIFEEIDEHGQRWLCAIGDIWMRYAQDVTGVLIRDKIKELSMEVAVFESGINDSIESFAFSGVTLIGVEPAIPNARAEVLTFEKVKSGIENILFTQSQEVKFDIPEIVKLNSQKGLAQYKKNKKGGTAIAVSVANALSFENEVNQDLIDKINKFATDKSNILLWGGKEGLLWAKECLNTAKKEEGEKMDEEKDKDLVENFEAPKEEEMACGEKEEMSADANVDPTAQAQMMEDDAEVNEEKAEEFVENEDDGEIEVEPTEPEKEPEVKQMVEVDAEEYAMLKDKVEAMEADKDVYMSELETLKEFKKNVEDLQMSREIESTLLDVKDSGIPSDIMENLKSESVNYSLENIQQWKNQVEATAYKFSKGNKNIKKDNGVMKVGLIPDVTEKKKGTGLWS